MSDPWVHHPNVTGTDDLMLTRNFLLILLANIVLGSAMPMLIILGGLAGGWLAPHVWLATAPPSTQMLVGIIVLGTKSCQGNNPVGIREGPAEVIQLVGKPAGDNPNPIPSNTATV